MWKRRVNDVLSRLTGHELHRTGTAPAAPAPAARPQPPAPRPRRGRRGLPRSYDAEAVEIIRRVRPRTMTGHEKLYALVNATRYVVQHELPGAFVECGVWRGGSMQAAALALQHLGVTDRDLHLYDTFEGMPPPTEHDMRHDGRTAADLLETSAKTTAVWAYASLDDVREGMVEVGYPTERIHYHEGKVEETIPDNAPDEIAILRLDTDWYESTKHELEHLYDRLVVGGVLILDDYGHWEGARLATDEFIERTGTPLLLQPIGSGRIAVKTR